MAGAQQKGVPVAVQTFPNAATQQYVQGTQMFQNQQQYLVGPK